MALLEIILAGFLWLVAGFATLLGFAAVGRTVQLHDYLQKLEKYTTALHDHVRITDEQVILLAGHVDQLVDLANAQGIRIAELENLILRKPHGNTVIVTPHRDPN